ncbi:MAG: hypothetical protein PHN19_00200 [Patescibacteria group bacterium]|nr:hypothetical protein [Patescibacteria group bacterium]
MTDLPSLDIASQLRDFFSTFGFIFVQAWWAIILGLIFLAYYAFFRIQNNKFLAGIEYVLLAISVPADSEKSPKSMEQVLAGFHGIYSPPNWSEVWIKGEQQAHISLELVGINGHVRFIVRTPIKLRDAIEAHIYAQYPDAELTEVEDYTEFIPNKWPNDQYELFGTDFKLMKPDSYPIRTYMQFAEEFDKGFIDPISAFTEVMGKLNNGEQIWLQITIRPVNDSWKEEGEKEVAKLIGKKVELPEDFFQKTVVKGWHNVLSATDAILQVPAAESKETKKEYESLMQFLSPGEQDVVTSIQRNIAKVGFETKFRFIYVAKKDVYQKGRGVVATLGALKLLHTQNLNWFWLDKHTKTKLDYWKFRIPGKQRKIVRYYKERDMDAGVPPCILSIEELATLFHFPYVSVESPSVISAQSSKAEPPSDLPVGRQ